MRLFAWLAALSLLCPAKAEAQQASTPRPETFHTCGFLVTEALPGLPGPVVQGSCAALDAPPFLISGKEIVLSDPYRSTEWDRDPVGFKGTSWPANTDEDAPFLMDFSRIIGCMKKPGRICLLANLPIVAKEIFLDLPAQPTTRVLLRGTTDPQGRDASHIALDAFLFQDRSTKALVVILPRMGTSDMVTRGCFVLVSHAVPEEGQ